MSWSEVINIPYIPHLPSEGTGDILSMSWELVEPEKLLTFGLARIKFSCSPFVMRCSRWFATICACCTASLRYLCRMPCLYLWTGKRQPSRKLSFTGDGSSRRPQSDDVPSSHPDLLKVFTVRPLVGSVTSE